MNNSLRLQFPSINFVKRNGRVSALPARAGRVGIGIFVNLEPVLKTCNRASRARARAYHRPMQPHKVLFFLFPGESRRGRLRGARGPSHEEEWPRLRAFALGNNCARGARPAASSLAAWRGCPEMNPRARSSQVLSSRVASLVSLFLFPSSNLLPREEKCNSRVDYYGRLRSSKRSATHFANYSSFSRNRGRISFFFYFLRRWLCSV